MSESIQLDLDLVTACEGMHLGHLSAEEFAAFRRCREAGLAWASYNDPAGFMGLGKVRLGSDPSRARTP